MCMFCSIGTRWLEAWVLAWLLFCLRVPWQIWASSSLRLVRRVCRSIMKTSTLLFRNCGRLLQKDSGGFCWAVMRLRKITCCKSAKYSRVLHGFADAGHVSDGLCVQISWHLHVPYQQSGSRPHLFLEDSCLIYMGPWVHSGLYVQATPGPLFALLQGVNKKPVDPLTPLAWNWHRLWSLESFDRRLPSIWSPWLSQLQKQMSFLIPLSEVSLCCLLWPTDICYEAFMLWLFHKLHHTYEASADSPWPQAHPSTMVNVLK